MKCGTCLALAVGLLASSPQVTFKSMVGLVVVPITVVGSRLRALSPGLSARDFRVFEDGVPQAVEIAIPDTRALSVCIVLDRSNSMESLHRQFAHSAIEAVLEGLGPGDEVAMLVFAGQLDVALPWTSAEGLPPIDWTRWPAADDTSLFDAVRAALRMLESARNRRSVVLLVTDGSDTSSHLSLDTLATTRRQSEASVFAFHAAPWLMATSFDGVPGATASGGTDGPDEAAASRNRMRVVASTRAAALAALTTLVGDGGGAVYPLRASEDSARAATKMLDELRNQYVIGYRPAKAMDGKFRRIKVELLGRRDLIRHRKGYLAAPGAPP